MLLIAAALKEELQIAASACRDCVKVRRKGVEFLQATREGRACCLLRTGVGPRKSAARLEQALEAVDADEILLVGYAGAIDPQLKLGTVVEVRRALLCRIDKTMPSLEHMRLENIFELSRDGSFRQAAESVRVPFCTGDTLTSSQVWGNPEHKRFLRERFQACIVDMETAALAGVSGARGVPLRCIRVVSDEAADSFLEPFSYDPEAGIPARAGQLIRKGNLVKAYRKWKQNAAFAGASLGRFLAGYL
jgi:adenosylhomocysteine nucleosidase